MITISFISPRPVFFILRQKLDLNSFTENNSNNNEIKKSKSRDERNKLKFTPPHEKQTFTNKIINKKGGAYKQ